MYLTRKSALTAAVSISLISALVFFASSSGSTTASTKEHYNQDPIIGAVPVHTPPYLALRMMFAGESSHEFNIPASQDPVRATASHGDGDSLSVLWKFGKKDPNSTWSHALKSHRLQYSVGFIVTSFHFNKDGKLLVAGVNRTSGETYIEAWTFQDPEVNGLGGAPQNIELIAGRLSARTPVFSPPPDAAITFTQGFMSGGGLGDNKVLMLTYPNTILCELDISSGSVSAIASASEAIGSFPSIPSLGEAWDRAFFRGEHVDYGNVYLLRMSADVGSPFSDTGVTGLGFVDYDKNGSLDDYFEIFTGTAGSLGLTDPDKWLE